MVQAAGTDAWQVVRERAARLLSRGDTEGGRAELERLDRTARDLDPGTATDLEGERLRQEGAWRMRFETLFESLDAAEQERAAAELRALLLLVADTGSGADVALATGNAVARDGGSAVTGVRRAGGDARPARAVNTGDAEATGPGSSAVSGIVHE
ncbi:hypothetical protein [Streptomyces sp. NPDC012888]|uniref:hypothetical protein n=1 Tax=Streptomyces sp. NPDC012888 TaxID=3364855 RepID=UPI0036903586